MKNSASIPHTIQADAIQAGAKQALRTQAQQILPALTIFFSNLNYSEISPQRLSQQSNGSELDYQGLTRAQHLQFGQVMIKWQLCADNNQNSADLTYEANVLTSINSLSKNQNSFTAIAPPLLAYENITLQILGRQQLTVLVMPYYPNGSLANQLSAQKHLLLTEMQKHQFIVQSAYLIYHLHQVGWLHNDIKPSNILLEGFLTNNADNSRITFDFLLTDFALARALHKPSSASSAGTPAYLAPERWQGQRATVQSDIYAFGIMMYEILVGERPFNLDSKNDEWLREWATRHCQHPIPILHLEYRHYQCIADKALAKRMDKRYQNMQEVLSDLETL